MTALQADILALDLETTKAGALHHIGAILGGDIFQWQGRGRADAARALTELDAFGRRAQFMLGHNLFSHDLPFLRAVAPDLELLNRPVIDTLFLSPLAFPRNPYHRLIKDYKLVRASLSDPLEDVRLALSVFTDQWESLARQGDACPELLALFAHCFRRSRFNGFSGRGLAMVLDRLSACPSPAEAAARDLFARLAGETICRNGLDNAFAALGPEPWHPAAAYALAWLRVAGTNSVLPPWVRHQFPAVVPFLRTLREIPCGDPDCAWCRASHDPDAQLQCFFGFEGFRPTPAAADGESLQRQVVLAGMQGHPLLAILPTGGGKSLCYQLPALVRHMRRGLLTVVFSPLQALMKDQVDNLAAATGAPSATAIYGLLTSPERGEAMERVRLGDIALLYISPEQLRSRSVRHMLSQREIGCWVFDEAHCLSKWGHDFRPDYLYAGRFIRELSEEQKLPLPPIACFTATAKPDVIEEIVAYFHTELRQALRLFEGGVERDNLTFDVLPVSAAEKPEQTFALIQKHLGGDGPGSAVVYTATRGNAETVRDYLLHKGVMAEAFHGGLEAHEKRRIIDVFTAGETAVICATNAFGMGIDKSDIRLVLHYEIPGSLENYLQEAGRAGRDQGPAHCVLLYDPADAETQFRLGSYSEIKRDEIQRILRCLKRGKRNRDNEIVITTGELLREEELAQVFDKQDRGADTKVRTAVSWLERADFLERNQNLTQVFQGKPLVKSLVDADPLIERAKLSPDMRSLWRGILAVLYNAPAGRGLSADDIAEQLFQDAARLRALEHSIGLTPAQLVIHAMHQMASVGLLDKGMRLSAFLHCGGRKGAPRLLAAVVDLETRMIKVMQEAAPETEPGAWQELDISRLNQRLNGDGHQSNPVTLRLLVKGLARDGQGLAGAHGSLDLQHIGRNRYRVALRRGWVALSETAALRRDVAALIATVLAEKARKALAAAGQGTTAEVLVDFSADELEQAIRQDLLLHARVHKPLAAIDRALMFLHEHKIITLQQGLSVFRQAMTIRLNPEDKRRGYTAGDFKPLHMHYRERRFQVHVILEYAALAMEKVARALNLVLDYFSLPRAQFVQKYFSDRHKLLERATSAEAYRQVVDQLGNPHQIAVVGAPVGASRLILAGPGAGKTRVVVHRCAYLLRVERIPPNRILVMCFNHGAAGDLRKRLTALVGNDARGVTVATYHGAAMRLAGISARELMEHRPATSPAAGIDFDHLIREAVALLQGDKEVPGLDPDELRDHLLQGYSHILVDEYQDIDQDQYDLVSAIAGRTLEEGNNRLAILAVGDDDQNIYAFRGANVAFIQRFQKEYNSKTVHLVENYRSSAHIIQAANQLIARNRDRMKANHPIHIDRRRRDHPPGGRWTTRDPIVQGRVQRLRVPTAAHQPAAVLQEIQRLRALDPDARWQDFAVLARTKTTLDSMRAHMEHHRIPLRRTLETGLPLHRIREVHAFLSSMKQIEPEFHRASALAAHLPAPPPGAPCSPWIDLLHDLHALYQDETIDSELSVTRYIDWLYSALAEQRREKALGRGLFLGTVHGAKGQEFNHVFILDGDWRHPRARAQQEEERRLLYVGMTRARETLCLMETADHPNPFTAGLQGQWMIQREARPIPGAHTWENVRYTLLTLADVHLGHAGRFPAGHPIHNRLSLLNAGDVLQMVESSRTIHLESPDGLNVAVLSKEARDKWKGRAATVQQARIVGMVRWCADDAQEIFRRYIKVPEWEVPLLELILAPIKDH